MAFNYNKLNCKIKEKYGTIFSFAKAVGISTPILFDKINNNSDFTQQEIRKCIKMLDINSVEIKEYFFTLKV